jgi:anti-anti-sigma factor
MAVKPFEVTYHDSDIAILSLVGEHDLSTSAELHRALRALLRSGERVIVDLSRAAFIDSSVLNNLVQARRRARERGSEVVLLVGTTPGVERVLQVTRLLEHFPHESTREGAIELARNGWGPAGG